LSNKKALPVAPVNLVEINSVLLVRTVSHEAQEKSLDPPI